MTKELQAYLEDQIKAILEQVKELNDNENEFIAINLRADGNSCFFTDTEVFHYLDREDGEWK